VNTSEERPGYMPGCAFNTVQPEGKGVKFCTCAAAAQGVKFDEKKPE
jgi:hypothetical protein